MVLYGSRNARGVRYKSNFLLPYKPTYTICDKNNITENEDANVQYGSVLIAMTEAVTNAIIHGNKSDSTKQVEITHSIVDNKLVFTVKDEGHGFVKKENQIKAYGDILKFLDKHLKKEEDVKG